MAVRITNGFRWSNEKENFMDQSLCIVNAFSAKIFKISFTKKPFFNEAFLLQYLKKKKKANEEYVKSLKTDSF